MNPLSQKILVTGVAGFLGSNLAHHLSSRNHKISGNDNFIRTSININKESIMGI